jgi:hypothetical protein
MILIIGFFFNFFLGKALLITYWGRIQQTATSHHASRGKRLQDQRSVLGEVLDFVNKY